MAHFKTRTLSNLHLKLKISIIGSKILFFLAEPAAIICVGGGLCKCEVWAGGKGST